MDAGTPTAHHSRGEGSEDAKSKRKERVMEWLMMGLVFGMAITKQPPKPDPNIDKDGNYHCHIVCSRPAFEEWQKTHPNGKLLSTPNRE